MVVSQADKEREIVQLNNVEMNTLKEILKIQQDKCYYCKEIINFKGKYSIFKKPTRLICDSIVCMAMALEEDEE